MRVINHCTVLIQSGAGEHGTMSATVLTATDSTRDLTGSA